MRSPRVALVTLSLLLAIPTLSVLAQENEGTDGEGEAAESEPPRATEYQVKVQDAIRRAKNRDYDAARAELAEAFQMEPSNPVAFYIAGEIDRIENQLPQALERFRTCVQFAGQADRDRYRARCLQAMAETLEGSEGELEAAREAWQTYVEFADAHRSVSNPEIGRERINAIDAQLQQAEEYVEVRQRIEERERFNRENANMGMGMGMRRGGMN
jgi:predicted Zn-dependent protease